MMMGLLGMAYFSAPAVSNTESDDYEGLYRDESVIVDDDDESDFALDPMVQMEWPGFTHFRGLQGSPSKDKEDQAVAVLQDTNDQEEPTPTETSRPESSFVDEETNSNNISNDISMDPTTVGEIDIIELPPQRRPNEIVVVCGMEWQRRTLGIFSAMFSGAYGGSMYVKSFCIQCFSFHYRSNDVTFSMPQHGAPQVGSR
jgi:hypothetical protein